MMAAILCTHFTHKLLFRPLPLDMDSGVIAATEDVRTTRFTDFPVFATEDNRFTVPCRSGNLDAHARSINFCDVMTQCKVDNQKVVCYGIRLGTYAMQMPAAHLHSRVDDVLLGMVGLQDHGACAVEDVVSAAVNMVYHQLISFS
jgi:hypothetical protein